MPAWTPTSEQQAIFDFIKNPKAGNLVVEAGAGAGKSSSLLEALKVIPQRSILLTAFNRAIADSLQAKLPKMPKTHAVHVKTFHALGRGMVKNRRPDLERLEGAGEELVTRVCAGRSISFNQKRWIAKLIGLLKETTIDRDPLPETAMELGFEHDIFGNKATDDAIMEAVEMSLLGYRASMDIDKLPGIEFADMVWLPGVLKLEPASRYQAVFIDELQDISRPQFELLRRVMLPTTRVVGIGDLWQSIYRWRGALGEQAWAIMRDEFKASTLKLSTTFRCCAEVVKQANQLVPELKALPDNTGGTVSTIKLSELPNAFVGGLRDDGIHTFVLSRRNDTLLDCALFLHRNKVKFHLGAGKEMLGPLFYLLDFVLDTNTYAKFETSLKAWIAKEQAKAIKHDQPSIADRALQHYTMLNRCALEAGQHPHKIKGILHALLVPNRSGVLLSTVHKVKGLEAERVFLLKRSFERHRRTTIGLPDGRKIELADWTNEQQQLSPLSAVEQEELNVEYVAITRAKWHLVWVDNDEQHVSTLEPSAELPDLNTNAPIDKLERAFEYAEREGQRLLNEDEDEAGRWFKYAEGCLHEINARSK